MAAVKVLLVGLRPERIEEFRAALGAAGYETSGTSSADGVRAAFAENGDIDHVFLGAGLDIAVRLEVVAAVYEASDAVTVHMKDRASGPEGFLPFATAVLSGLERHQPRGLSRHPSPAAP